MRKRVFLVVAGFMVAAAEVAGIVYSVSQWHMPLP